MTESRAPLSFLLDSEFSDKYPHQLVARYPHIAQHIESLWHNADAVADYFSDLMIPSRPNRQGFPADVAAEIMSLSMAFDRIGSLTFVDEKPKQSKPMGVYHWETESQVGTEEPIGFDLTRAGFAKAAEAGNREACARFVKAGFDVDTRDARDWTPLMIAAFYGREQLAVMLLECGADIYAKDSGGYSSLHWAAFSGYLNLVRLLLLRGLPANLPSNAGITPLLQAAARGHLEVVKLLLDKQANPNLNANDGSSPLLKAVANNHLAVCQVLLNAGAHRNVTLRDGTNLDDIVAKVKDPRIRAILA